MEDRKVLKVNFQNLHIFQKSKFQFIEDIFKGESSRFCFVLFCQCGGKCNTGRKYKESCQNLASQLHTGRRITQDPKHIQKLVFHLTLQNKVRFVLALPGIARTGKIFLIKMSSSPLDRVNSHLCCLCQERLRWRRLGKNWDFKLSK